MSDGDLRRLLESKGPEALAMTAGDAMNAAPRTIAADEFAARALKHHGRKEDHLAGGRRPCPHRDRRSPSS